MSNTATSTFGFTLNNDKQVMDMLYDPLLKGINSWRESLSRPEIKKVIFNPPATIVMWSDKSKTVVKCRDVENYDKWTGLAMCICKKIYGAKFHGVFNRWCK